MPKIIYKIISLIFLLLTLPVIATIFSYPAYALPSCPVQTNPTALLNTYRKAKFTINVGDNKNYDKYKMEFKCVTPFVDPLINEKRDAVKEGDTDISVDLDKSSELGDLYPCEFSEGNHEILVKAVVGNDEVPQCITTYPVGSADVQCKLSINPESGITSATKLTVSGKDLTEGGKFVVFFDKNAIDIPDNPFGLFLRGDLALGNVNTPTFGPKSIPQELMTPGVHTISLRQSKGRVGNANPLLSEKDFYGRPLCSVSFTVGPPGNPGSVISMSTGSTPTRVCTKEEVERGQCTSGGARPCGNDTDNPGIQTAIGCIHTSPVGFIKDFLKFIIGIAGGLAFLMMLLGAFQMLTSAGNPETLAAGRDRLTSAVIGLLFVIFAVLLLRIIGVDILGLGEQFGFK